MQGESGVHVDSLSHRFGASVVLDTVNLSLSPGRWGLLGPNGAGKTTLLRIIATLLSPTSGRVLALGHDLGDRAGLTAVRRVLGYVPQNAEPLPGVSAVDYLLYCCWLKGIPSKQSRPAAFEALERMNLLDVADQRATRLSGGTRRRLTIASSLLGAPRLIVLDEPTTGLDPEQRVAFRDILTGLDDTVALVSTHLAEDVSLACNHVVVLAQGRLLHQGTVVDFIGSRSHDIPGVSPIESAYLDLIRGS